jgi:hypothetical protein
MDVMGFMKRGRENPWSDGESLVRRSVAELY